MSRRSISLNPGLALPGLLLTMVFFAVSARAVTPWSLSINTNNIVVVTNAAYGAVADGVTDDTAAISNAIVAVSHGTKTNNLYGGTVEIPAGANAYMCGPLNLANNVNLQIDAGALLRMLPYSTWPGVPYASSSTVPNFINGNSLTNIEISGGGAIDGQGAPWWPGYKTNTRPIMIRLNSCKWEMIQNVTLSNSPEFHISISGSSALNTTVQGVTVRAPDSSIGNPPSHNTDACDVDGQNILVQNCNISTGDDDFTCGGGTFNVLVTNNTYGYGHGVSIGSYTDSGGVSNITVINCTFNQTQNGVRIKSDNDRGGLVKNIYYYNLTMTNVNFPIQLYAYYNEVGTPSSVTPYYAATQAVETVNSLTPIYKDIIYSNITATSANTYPIGFIWARREAPATNILFYNLNLTGDRSFEIYNVVSNRLIDCNLQPSASTTTLAIYGSQVTVTNSSPTNRLVTLDGITTNGLGSTLAFYNAAGSLKNTNALDHGPLLLSASTFTVSNDMIFPANTLMNFILGTNAAQLAVKGNLMPGGTNNIYAGPGFTNGTYILMTYTGSLSGGLPVLGALPAGYNYAYDTSTAGLVKLVVTIPAPPAPTNLLAFATNLLINLSWNAVTGAGSYNVKRGTANGGPYPVVSNLTVTNFADGTVSNAVTYYYVVTAVGSAESTNSAQVSAIPLPSNQPTNMLSQVVGNQLQLSWPQDHLGWRLQIQTNDLNTGLSNNWVTVPNSTAVDTVNVPMNTSNGAVLLRLVYP